MISQNTIQQILSRIDIIDVIGAFVKLKKRGTNYLGLCPFHNERTPSFTVSPSKEIYKCFGCGKSGNTISFLMEHEKYSYVDSLRWLANKYGIEIEETFASDEQKQQMQVADSLYIINNFAQQFFAKTLFETEEGRHIGLSYLKERGFREDIIKKFQLGYNPEARDSFTKAAIAAQYNTELLLKTGLVANRNDQLMDNYRGRIIFPVHNHSGKVLGFGARILKTNDKAPKYINTPENEIYVKSKILYGSYFARMAIDKADECLLVEGYTDVISLHQSGIENVVASGGTSLTQDQLRLIRKYTNNLTIIYDGDAAGIKAALRGLDLALEEGLNVKLVLIPDKEDPDSYVNKVGASAFNEFVRSNKKDFILFQLEVALKDVGTDTTKKAEIVNSIAETISKINKVEDFTKQQDYIKQCSEILKIDEAGLHALVNRYIKDKIIKEHKPSFGSLQNFEENTALAEKTEFTEETFTLLHRDDIKERSIVKGLVLYGDKEYKPGYKLANYIYDDPIDESLFDNQLVLKFIKAYKQNFFAGIGHDLKYFLYNNDNELSPLVISVTNFPYELSSRWVEYDSARGYREELFEKNCEEFIKIIHYDNATELTTFLRTQEDNTIQEVVVNYTYLKIKKTERLMLENQNLLINEKDSSEYISTMLVHQYLKDLHISLTRGLHTVIARHPNLNFIAFMIILSIVVYEQRIFLPQ